MNDKNFIEELKQKREEYGVTQTRLAVTSDELKETIQKQIERFNPQEPLFLLIDYFRVRFPTTNALAIIRDVLQLKPDYMFLEDYGKYGYESQYVLGDINIMCSTNEQLGVLLELKGRGCRQMESYLLAQERSWYDFIPDCLTAGECMSLFRNQKGYDGTEKCGHDILTYHDAERTAFSIINHYVRFLKRDDTLQKCSSRRSAWIYL